MLYVCAASRVVGSERLCVHRNCDSGVAVGQAGRRSDCIPLPASHSPDANALPLNIASRSERTRHAARHRRIVADRFALNKGKLQTLHDSSIFGLHRCRIPFMSGLWALVEWPQEDLYVSCKLNSYLKARSDVLFFLSKNWTHCFHIFYLQPKLKGTMYNQW